VRAFDLNAPTPTSQRVGKALRLTNYAWITVLAALGLSLIGIYCIDVAQSVSALSGAAPGGYAAKQLAFLAIGMLAAACVAAPPYRWLGYFAPVGYILIIGFLIFLLVPGVPKWIVTPRNGARSWIDVGPIDIQPSEIAKIIYVIMMARFMRYRDSHRTLAGLIPPALITGVPLALILLQPDLGTAVLFMPVLFAMLVAAGAKLKHLVIIVLAAALFAPATYPFLKPHQKARFVGLFKQIEGDKATAQDINFQAYTAQTLSAAGGVVGVGEEKARALVHFSRLPERHNDMIFSVLLNRFGLFGGLVALLLYFLWTAGALMAAAATRDPFGRLIVVGLTAFVLAQALINIAMNIGLAPITGITLPFLSYGGSSMVSLWLMVGIILNIAMRRPRPPVRNSFEYGDHDD
jgi:rod shape determining protein RodA